MSVWPSQHLIRERSSASKRRIYIYINLSINLSICLYIYIYIYIYICGTVFCILWCIESSQEQHWFEIEIFCNILKKCYCCFWHTHTHTHIHMYSSIFIYILLFKQAVFITVLSVCTVHEVLWLANLLIRCISHWMLNINDSNVILSLGLHNMKEGRYAVRPVHYGDLSLWGLGEKIYHLLTVT